MIRTKIHGGAPQRYAPNNIHTQENMMTTNNRIRICAAAALLLCCGTTLRAQDDRENTDEKLRRELTLEREYDPGVQDADKVNRLPEVKDPQVTQHKIEYSRFTTTTDPDREIITLPSGRVMTDIPYNTRRGYFHYGLGTHLNMDGDLGYHFIDNETDRLNAALSVRSTHGHVQYNDWGRDEQRAKYTDLRGALHYAHRFAPATFRIGARYRYNTFNYYGFPLDSIYRLGSWPLAPTTSYPADRDRNQRNQTFDAYLGLQSADSTDFSYHIDLSYLHFVQRYGHTVQIDGLQENRFTLRMNLLANIDDRYFGLDALAHLFNYTYPAAVRSAIDFNGYRSHAQITLTPYYRFTDERFRLRLGLNLGLITGDSAKFFAGPAIRLDAMLAERTLLYARAEGHIGMNDAASIADQNRYVDHALKVRPSRTWLDAELGIRTGITPGLWFDAFAGYAVVKSALFFVPADYLGQPYDFGNYSLAFQPDATWMRLGAALKYAYQQTVDFSVKAVYNRGVFRKGDGNTWLTGHGLDRMKPYGRPGIEVNADLTVRPITPLALTLDYYMGAGRFTLFHGDEIKLTDLHDLTFTTAYTLNDTFGAYVKLTNLLFRRQDLWYGYPMQRFGVMGGININF